MEWRFNRFRWFILGIVLATSSCVSDAEFKAIDPYYLFHDNSSKVWLIKHKYQDGNDFSPLSLEFKDIITIHKSHNCYVQRMGTFGNIPGDKGQFYLDAEENEARFEFKNQSWIFTIKSMQLEKIILEPTTESDLQFTLELIPVPEP
jgi:hypothetical protein